MSRARDIADLVDSNGDIVAGALDNVPAADVVNDTTPQLGGDFDTNGNDINFGDNDKAQFGAGNDLQIFHDGSDSYVKDAGSGNLTLQGTNLNMYNTALSKIYLNATDGGSVDLYYDNAQKLATTSTGVDVTGDVLADTVTLDNGSNDWQFSVSGNNLIISYAGTSKAKLDSSGNLTVVGDVTAFGTI